MIFLSEPEPERGVPLSIVPGIRRLVAPNPGPMTYRGTNTYLIESPEGVLVLDPGPADPSHVGRIIEAGRGRIAGILLSHAHQDHVGALAALRQATKAPVHAWHLPADPAVAPDVPLRDGDRVGEWEAIHTPGHAPDHLCFAGPGGVLFSGDHVMSWSSTVVGPPGGSMADYFDSLRRLLARKDDACLLPGHGPPLGAPRAFIEELLAHRAAREAALCAALDTTPRSARELAGRLYPELDPSLRRAAERNVVAHLQKLRVEKLAEETPRGWVARSDSK